MTAAIATKEPLQARAGLTWQWRREDLADYPAPTWTLIYWFKKTGATQANFSITATADGAYFAVTVSASTTDAYTAGTYTWAAIVTAGSESFEVDHGALELLPKYSAVANLDDRSHARKTLDAINAVIEGRATLDQQEYAIGNRSLKRMPIADLLMFKSRYEMYVASEVAADRLAQGRTIGGKIQVRL